ncbi:MAG: GNAT family N-acetyltransferase [Alphaproteobacteria bacterium]|nr:GNAT family N-acetyltransferase [Alphaproteobacteria bacterium]
MKKSTFEFGHSYETYSFAYCLYVEKEKKDTLSDIYNAGYLPFTAAKGIKNIFYMARSARYPVQQWKETSENKRVFKKFDDVFEKEILSVADIRHDTHFFDVSLTYFKKTHGLVMPRKRLELILDFGIIKEVVVYKKDGVAQAYILITGDDVCSHYWFSFYDVEYQKSSLGMWLALDYIRSMKKTKQTYFYFGTCYAEKALYKTNIEPLEYWDGSVWVKDKNSLKTLCRTDTTRKISGHKDMYKSNLELF